MPLAFRMVVFFRMIDWHHKDIQSYVTDAAMHEICGISPFKSNLDLAS